MIQKKQQEEREKLLNEIFLIWKHGFMEGTANKVYNFKLKSDRKRLDDGIFTEFAEEITKIFNAN